MGVHHAVQQLYILVVQAAIYCNASPNERSTASEYVQLPVCTTPTDQDPTEQAAVETQTAGLQHLKVP